MNKSENYLYLAYVISVMMALVQSAYFGLFGIMELREDFDVLDPNKWTVIAVDPSRSNVTVENGYLKILVGVYADVFIILNRNATPEGENFETLELMNVTINITRELYTRPPAMSWETVNELRWATVSTTGVINVTLEYVVNGTCDTFGGDVVTCTVSVEPVAIVSGRQYTLFSYLSSVYVNESKFPSVHFDYLKIKHAVNETGRYVQITYFARVYLYGTGGELTTRTKSGQLTVKVDGQGNQKLVEVCLSGLNYGYARLPPPDQPIPMGITNDAFPFIITIDKLYIKTVSEPSPPEESPPEEYPSEETTTTTEKIVVSPGVLALIAITAVSVIVVAKKRAPLSDHQHDY